MRFRRLKAVRLETIACFIAVVVFGGLGALAIWGLANPRFEVKHEAWRQSLLLAAIVLTLGIALINLLVGAATMLWPELWDV